MLAVDTAMVVMAIAGTVVVFLQWRPLKKASAVSGVLLLLAGLWVGASLYIADLTVMLVLPNVAGMKQSMTVMRELHLGYSWYINVLSAAMLLVGLILTLWRILVQLTKVDQAKSLEEQLRRSERMEEQLLQESEERLREAFESVTTGNIIIDEQGIIDRCNSVSCRIFGYAQDELIGRNVSMLMPEPDRSLHNDRIRRYVETGDAKIIGIGGEVTGLRKNGEEFPMHLGIGEMSIGGQRAFIGSVTDLTETKALEVQLFKAQRMEAVGQLTGGIAHDFNNVMATVLGNAEVLEEKFGDDDDTSRLVAPIIRAVERGSSLTHRLLAFSRQQTLAPVSTDVARVIDGLEDILVRALGETIKLEIHRPSRLWPAMIDPAQFESALLNLAINARDAMPNGGTLVIESTNTALDESYADRHEDMTAGDYVQVAVSDSGTGMPPEVLEMVFEPFFTTKETGGGSGLGLSMVYGFAKQSSGHATVHSEEGEGTTVRLYLPRAEKHVAEDESQIDISALERGTERILVVEDEESVRTIAVRLLREQGYDVLDAADGRAALDLLKLEGAFDLLFTDVVLPGGMNGVEVADAARELQPDIKVLYTTGYAENSVLHHRKLDAGIVLVNKPYRRAELVKKVQAMLESRSVLLIEDDEDLRATLVSGLKGRGFNVVEASGGRRGVELVRSGSFDIVVTDVVMAEGEGVESIHWIKEASPDTPVIAISGEPLFLDSMKTFGAVAALQKPFRTEELVEEIRNSLQTDSRTCTESR